MLTLSVSGKDAASLVNKKSPPKPTELSESRCSSVVLRLCCVCVTSARYFHLRSVSHWVTADAEHQGGMEALSFCAFGAKIISALTKTGPDDSAVVWSRSRQQGAAFVKTGNCLVAAKPLHISILAWLSEMILQTISRHSESINAEYTYAKSKQLHKGVFFSTLGTLLYF